HPTCPRAAPRSVSFYDPAARPEPYPLSLHDALPICQAPSFWSSCGRADTKTKATSLRPPSVACKLRIEAISRRHGVHQLPQKLTDRKSTRLNSSHVKSSYAVFCLKKKNRSTN